MSGKTSIEWTEQTWNPIVGCSIVSPGCTNCYAMKMAARIEAMGNQPRYAGTTKKVNGNAVWTGKLAQAPDSVLLAPLKRKKPTTYFVNSMGDLFHEDCPDEWIDRVFAVMALSPQHTFQVLTKRAPRMRDYMNERWQGTPAIKIGDLDIVAGAPTGRRSQIEEACEPFLQKLNLVDTDNDTLWTAEGACKAMQWSWPLPNVWLGVSTERQQEADERIPLLLQTPAAIRFISAEPLLGPIDLTRLCLLAQKPGSIRAGIHINALAGKYCESGMPYTGAWDVTKPAPTIPPIRLDWVICGGESGHGARQMAPSWAVSLRDQCAASGTAFFMKQMTKKAEIPAALFIRQMPQVAA
jgi:protein gp37